MLIALVEAAILASSCSLDAFTACFGYGGNKIRIPMLSAQIINLICSAILGVSLWLGAVVRPWLPASLSVALCFAILFILGLAKLLDSATKSFIRKHSDINKEVNFSLLNFNFILKLYADPEAADIDRSRTISPAEATALAVSLSLDGLAVGFGAGMAKVNAPAVFIASLITNMAVVLLGCYLGEKAAKALPFNLSWLSGIILIALAVSKLL